MATHNEEEKNKFIRHLQPTTDLHVFVDILKKGDGRVMLVIREEVKEGLIGGEERVAELTIGEAQSLAEILTELAEMEPPRTSDSGETKLF